MIFEPSSPDDVFDKTHIMYACTGVSMCKGCLDCRATSDLLSLTWIVLDILELLNHIRNPLKTHTVGRAPDAH